MRAINVNPLFSSNNCPRYDIYTIIAPLMTENVSGRRRSKRGPDERGGPGGALHDAHRRDRLRGHHRHLRVHLEEEETRGGRKCKFRIFRYFDILGKDYPVYRVSSRINLSLFCDASMYETNERICALCLS